MVCGVCFEDELFESFYDERFVWVYCAGVVYCDSFGVEIEGDGPPVIAVYMMGQCGVEGDYE